MQQTMNMTIEQNDGINYESVEKMPQFPGGMDALNIFMNANIQYPVRAAKKGISGKVLCSFVIDKEGNVKDVEVIQGVDPEIDAEAVRVIELMPRWKPGEQKGEKVNVKFTFPVNFQLYTNKK